jgi:uroporphyrin-3 C-methyltransferase
MAAQRWRQAAVVAVVLVAVLALWQAWNTQQRLKTVEAELVKRQQDSADQSTEARTLAREAEARSRESDAKLALLEARVAETTMQRSQLEDLIQSLARSRDENVLADIDASLRVAMQQSAITGSADPLVATLKQADERLARYDQPRLERIRRAVAQDLERARAAGVVDITVLTIRLDEVIREVDQLPLLSMPERHHASRAEAAGAASLSSSASPVAASAASAAEASGWRGRLKAQGNLWAGLLWAQAKDLLRVTRIDDPDAMLIAPDQAYFLRENLKLRLLNARLALLSRQFDTAQSDLRDAESALQRYFDGSSRQVTLSRDLVRQIMEQARLVTVPRPDATLAAIATATAGR